VVWHLILVGSALCARVATWHLIFQHCASCDFAKVVSMC